MSARMARSYRSCFRRAGNIDTNFKATPRSMAFIYTICLIHASSLKYRFLTFMVTLGAKPVLWLLHTHVVFMRWVGDIGVSTHCHFLKVIINQLFIPLTKSSQLTLKFAIFLEKLRRLLMDRMIYHRHLKRRFRNLRQPRNGIIKR